MKQKQPKPVRAWVHLLNGKICANRIFSTRTFAVYYAGFDGANVIPVEIRPVPKAKARKR